MMAVEFSEHSLSQPSEGCDAQPNVGAHAPTYYRRNTDAIPTPVFETFGGLK